MRQSVQKGGADTNRLLLRVYRVATPMLFEKKAGKLRSAAFLLRRDEMALSVYDASRVQPRQLFQRFLDDTRKVASTGDEETRLKMQRRLEANGQTVEEMYQKGWRVGIIDADIFERLGLVLEGPDDEAGHYSVLGTAEDFEEVADILADTAQTLSEEQTFAF